MDLLTVTGILLGVGVIMFLLPPVPGVPIYLTLGIVIVPIGRDVFPTEYPLVICMAYASLVSLGLKLFATFLQQKMIGGLLKGFVSVRSMVGINTSVIRAMKLSLNEKGLGIAKVSILCGGPDWPTSVLCGIMDLPLLPILVGTLPVFALVIPTVLAGSFMYMGGLEVDGSPEFPWASTASTICQALSALVMFAFVISAGYYVEQNIRTRGEELKEMPFDEEVKKLDDEAVAMNEAYEEVTEWQKVPMLARFCILSSLGCVGTSCYIVQLFQEDAFTEYQLTSTIDAQLKGDWTNLVKPIGNVALLLFAASLVFLFIFRMWANFEARRLLKKSEATTTAAFSDEI